MSITAGSRGKRSPAGKKSLKTTTSSSWGFAKTSVFGGTRPRLGESTPLFSMSSNMAKVIFVGLKKVVGGALFFFGSMAGTDEVAMVLTKGEELKLC